MTEMPETPSPVLLPDLSIEFAPTRFNTTLVEAVLRYRLTILNRGTAPLGPLIVFGAMEAAGSDPAQGETAPTAPQSERPFRPAPGFSPHPHFTPYASPANPGQGGPPRPDDAPAGPRSLYAAPADTPAPLPECHRLPLLQPGEGADFAGQMRLPLAGIAPIRVGSAALFVPLVRLKVEADRDGSEQVPGDPFIRELCVIVGQAAPGETLLQAGGGSPSLAPLRLDPEAATVEQLAIRAMPLSMAG